MNLVGNNLKWWMGRIISGGVRENHDHETQLQIILINIISIIAIPTLILLGIDVFNKGNSTLGFFDFSIAFILIITQIHLRRTGTYSSARYFVITFVGAHFIFNLSLGE